VRAYVPPRCSSDSVVVFSHPTENVAAVLTLVCRYLVSDTESA
jgi:hypothetical protein